MKKAATLFAVLAVTAVISLAQTDTTTRPRVAVTPTPPTIKDPYSSPTTTDKPPVLLGGDRRPVPSATGTPAAGDDEVIRVETNLVTMPVSVLDRDGRFISGLQQRDFKIFEDGIEQKIDYFQSVEQPFTVVLLIDVSPSTQFRIDEIQTTATGRPCDGDSIRPQRPRADRANKQPAGAALGYSPSGIRGGDESLRGRR
jgi:Ca-activated chloride channel family protein